ncbi:MAG: hypothetical protein C4318_01540 [Acidimicrobiia bacterium]
MRRIRRIALGNDFLQAIAVLGVSSLFGIAMWYWLWPFGLRLQLALVGGVSFGAFCSLGSWLRSRDIEWERTHTRALPLTFRRRVRRL